jgi:hypothetical protein
MGSAVGKGNWDKIFSELFFFYTFVVLQMFIFHLELAQKANFD